MAKKNLTSIDAYLKKFFVVAVTVSLPLFVIAAITNTGGGVNFAAKPSGPSGYIGLTDPEAQLSYGDSVSFVTSTEGKMHPKGRTYIRVVCRQESIVYQWSSWDLNFIFPLVDQNGQNLEWDGGPATCTGTLIYRVDQSKRNITILALDSVEFEVAGSQ